MSEAVRTGWRTGINDVNDNVEHSPVILFHVHLHGA